jgi:hypothetical protein
VTTRVPEPRAWRLASLAAGALVVSELGVIIARNADFVAAHAGTLVWIAGGLAAGLALFGVNGVGVALRDVGPFLGAGVLALTVGFGVQRLVNGALVRALPPHGIGAYLLLGLGAAVCQTAGKLIGIALVLRTRPPRGPRDVLAVGLAVGLGFGLTEVVFLGQGNIAAHADLALLPWVGIWERATAVAFHTYSGSLLALALRRRAWQPLALVLGVHTVNDGLAGANGSHVVTLPLVLVEAVFTLGAAVVWLAHRRLGARALADGSRW